VTRPDGFTCMNVAFEVRHRTVAADMDLTVPSFNRTSAVN